MRAMLGMTIGAVLALTAGVAVADELTGTISNIDLTRNTFQLEGKTFTASPSNTVGDKLADAQAGRAAGVGEIFLVRSGHALEAGAEAQADSVFDDLAACVDALVSRG